MSNFRGISEPQADLLALVQTAQELKENVELLTGQRGPRERSISARLDRIERDLDAIIARIRALENP